MDKYIVIKDDQRGLDRQFQKLISEPESFTEEEIQHLVEVTFKDQLTTTDKLALIETRNRKYTEDSLAHEALLAIIHRDQKEYGRLMAILEHRRSLKLLADQSKDGAVNDTFTGKPSKESDDE